MWSLIGSTLMNAFGILIISGIIVLVILYTILAIPFKKAEKEIEEAIKETKINLEKDFFQKKFTKEILEEINKFSDDEREKLLFLIREKIKEKKENVKKFFNDE